MATEGWPARVAPMLATAQPLPRDGAGLGWEFKWDGARCGARRRRDGQVRLDSRNGGDLTPALPEISEAVGASLPGRRVVLDGEIVAHSPLTHAPDFARLQQRIGVAPSAELLDRVPVHYVVFDLLELDGEPTIDLPYQRRRELLAALELTHPRLSVPPHQVGIPPQTLLNIAAEHRLEGVVGKRLDSAYRPGRSRAWVKTAIRHHLEVIIGGWIPSHGGTGANLGALLVGRAASPRTPGGRVRVEFVGGVGTGWSHELGRRIRQQLDAMARPSSPFSTSVPAEHTRNARWVHPRLVADVDYRGWTTAGYMRHPSFKGLRPDRDPRTLVEELNR